MKVVFDEKGNWNVVNEVDALVYQGDINRNYNYTVYNLSTFIWRLARTGLKIGCLLAILFLAPKLDNTNLHLIILVMTLLELYKTIHW